MTSGPLLGEGLILAQTPNLRNGATRDATLRGGALGEIIARSNANKHVDYAR